MEIITIEKENNIKSRDQSKALRSLMSSVQPLSLQEQKKRQNRIKKLTQQQGEEAADTFLSEQLGLEF